MLLLPDGPRPQVAYDKILQINTRLSTQFSPKCCEITVAVPILQAKQLRILIAQ